MDILLKEGDFFGERSFFTCLKRENSAISSKFTTLYMIKLDDFFKIIKENNDYVRITKISLKITKNTKGKLSYDKRKDFAIKRFFMYMPEVFVMLSIQSCHRKVP